MAFQIDIGTAVTLGLFALVHTAGLIWWMSKVATTIGILNATVEKISTQLSRHEATYYSKEDAVRDLTIRDKQLEAMWKRIDELKDRK